MSVRTVVRDISWRHCLRRNFNRYSRQLQQAQPQRIAKAGDLLKALTAGDNLGPPNPSSLSLVLPEKVKLKPPKAEPPKSRAQKSIVPATRDFLPNGYDANAYENARKVAAKGKKPTPKELSDLLRLMDFDSPMGEMRHEAYTIWKEMRKRGVIPSAPGYTALINLASKVGDVLMQDEIVDAMPKDNIPITQQMVHSLLEGMNKNREPERALMLFHDMLEKGVKPKLRTWSYIIGNCVENREPEEAYRLLLKLKETEGEKSVADHLWWVVLDSCAREGHIEGTRVCWNYLLAKENIKIPEGVCLNVLTTAAKHGDPSLATSVFNELSNLSIQFDAQHFLPLLEAYTRANDVRQAFIVLNIMRATSLTPPQLHHFNFLIQHLATSKNIIDSGFFLLQDLVEKEGRPIDITAYNIVLQAAIERGDSARAISTYRDAKVLKIRPNLETINLLLRAAQQVGHVDLAMVLLEDLKNAQITPDRDTYTRVILTYLTQQGVMYDQAFLYLEEMKNAGWIPPSGLYTAFIKKCVYHGDDRSVGLLDEMKKIGYPTKTIEEYVLKARSAGAESALFSRRGMGFERRQEARMEEEELTKRIADW